LSAFKIAVKNLKQKPVRTVAILLGIAALSGMLFALTIIYLSVNNSIEKGRARLGADALVVPQGWQEDTKGILLSGGPSAFYMKADVEEKLRNIKGVAATASQLFVISAPLSCCTVSDTMLIGFDPEKDFTISPWLRETLKKKLSDNEVIIGTNILAEPGGRIKFYGKEFLIAGKLEPTGMKFIDSSVFIPMNGVRQMIAGSEENALKTLRIKPDEISAVLLRFDQDVRHEEVALRIEYALPELKVVLASDVLRTARHNLAVPVKSTVAAGVIQWIVSLIMIGVLYSLSVDERTKEIGLLRAMGAKRKDILGIFINEVFLLSSAGGIAGIVCGIVFILSFQNMLRVFFNVPFLFPSLAYVLLLMLAVLAFALASGLVATSYPIVRASGISPYEAIRKSG
jgi:putative ABC transport system permease protein